MLKSNRIVTQKPSFAEPVQSIKKVCQIQDCADAEFTEIHLIGTVIRTHTTGYSINRVVTFSGYKIRHRKSHTELAVTN